MFSAGSRTHCHHRASHVPADGDASLHRLINKGFNRVDAVPGEGGGDEERLHVSREARATRRESAIPTTREQKRVLEITRVNG